MYHIQTTIGLQNRTFTLCEKGVLNMDVYVTVGKGVVFGVYTTKRKAAVQAEGLNREGIPTEVYEFQLNEDTEDDDDTQDTA